jgi:tetratricopeptide (TPR) repeat protein/DNA-binding Xre family transcriptional regulator
LPHSALDPLRIPAEFWDREDVIHASQQRSFRLLFLLLSSRANASQTKIAAACGLTQATVSTIQNGKHQPTKFDLIERIGTGLGMPDRIRALWGLAAGNIPDPPAPQPGPADTAHATADVVHELSRAEPDVRACPGSVLDAVRFPDGGAAAELVELSHALDQRTVGRGELTAAELVGARLDHDYAQLGPNRVLPQVRSLLSATITHLNQPQPLHHQRRLRILAGRLAGLRAWLCFDLGQDGEAERWYDLAVSAALDAEEWSLAAWLLGGRSLIPSLRHDHRRAVALIDRAVSIVHNGADNTTRAWVWALHARGRAGLGDQDGFEQSSAQALTAAERSTEHERRHGMDFVAGMLDLRYYTGTSRLLLHQPAHAADMLLGSLEALPTEHTKARAVLTLNLADAAAQTGQIDEAISLTRSALTSAGHQPILPILHQARRIRAYLGADHAIASAELDADLHHFAAALTAVATGSQP